MLYVYRKIKDGELVELEMSIAEMESRQVNGLILLDNGDMAKRDYAAEKGGFKHSPALWPMWSTAMGTASYKIKEQREYDKTLGFDSEFNHKGQILFRDRDHRKRYCEAHGYCDLDGGYGDPRSGLSHG